MIVSDLALTEIAAAPLRRISPCQCANLDCRWSELAGLPTAHLRPSGYGGQVARSPCQAGEGWRRGWDSIAMTVVIAVAPCTWLHQRLRVWRRGNVSGRSHR